MTATLTTDEVLFQEEQSFRQPWLWGLMLAIALAVAGGLAAGLAAEPTEAGDALVPAAVVVLVWGLVCLLLYTLKLSVRVDRHSLHVRFFPLLTRDLPLEDIARWQACTYRPILDYGGWGIRFSWKGTAYNVSGNCGVRLELTNGKRLLLGSQRVEELEAAITRAKGCAAAGV
jgi:hypothetical protein